MKHIRTVQGNAIFDHVYFFPRSYIFLLSSKPIFDCVHRFIATESTEYTSAPIPRLPNDFQYTIPSGLEIKEYKDYVTTFPEIDSPEVFGLHPNADLTFRLNEVGALIHTLGETQPKGSGGGGGVSREDVVQNKASELLERLPEDFVEDDYKAKLNKLGGLDKPLNIFLFQEIQRLQKVIGKVRFILIQLQLAINGEVVMTDELQQTLDAMVRNLSSFLKFNPP